MSKKDIDWPALYAQAEAETIAEITAQILANPDEYECAACSVEGQPCDVGLAVKIERERIIKLLQDSMCSSKYDNPDNGDCMGYCYNCQWKMEVIELIKGETK